jgi:hypothetical protein
MTEFKSKHTHNVEKFKAVLNKQIISKITGNYLKREEEHKIITSYQNLLNLIEASEKGKFQKQTIYMDLFKKIMN